MILLRLVLFVDVLIKAKLKGFQARLHPMMWTELLTKRELQSTKKIGWCNIYIATFRAVFKKISKVHSLSLPICHVTQLRETKCIIVHRGRGHERYGFPSDHWQWASVCWSEINLFFVSRHYNVLLKKLARLVLQENFLIQMRSHLLFCRTWGR